jgi:hypothetical protein
VAPWRSRPDAARRRGSIVTLVVRSRRMNFTSAETQRVDPLTGRKLVRPV